MSRRAWRIPPIKAKASTGNISLDDAFFLQELSELLIGQMRSRPLAVQRELIGRIVGDAILHEQRTKKPDIHAAIGDILARALDYADVVGDETITKMED